MKIFYIAVHEQNASWGAESFVNKGFVNHNHQTFCLDYRRHRSSLRQKFDQVPDFDVLFLQRGDGFPVELLEACQRPKIFWASELVSRCRDQDRLLSSGQFDHVFVHSPECLKTVVERGWLPREKVSVLLNGFDQETHYKLSGLNKDIDVLFIGSMTSRRQEIINQINGKVQISIHRAFGKGMSDLFRCAKIVLNIHAASELDVETRIFEALGCGAFVLTEQLDSHSPFRSGIHLVECTVEEMANQISYYLAHEGERRVIANCGYSTAVQNHSYDTRSVEIASILQQCIDQKQSVGPALTW